MNTTDTIMDNRTLLASLNLSQQAWGRLCGCNPRTAQKWFEDGIVKPVLVNRLLRFFVAYPRVFKAFQAFIKESPSNV